MSNIEATRVMGAAGAMERTLVAPGGGSPTLAMPGQADPQRTQMGGTTICPVCSSTTPLMDAYCGDCGFLLSSTPADTIAPPVEDVPPAELVEPGSGRRFRLREGVNTVGRQGTDILVNDGTVSRAHARVTVTGGVVTVEDLGSSNGTKVGDQRLSANQPVQATSGQNVRFGNWNVTLEVANGTSSAPADATIAVPVGQDATLAMTAPAAFSDEDTFIASAVTSARPQAQPTGGLESVAGGALVATMRKLEGPADDIAVTEGSISIGRRPENIIVLVGDAYASGKHAEIVTDATETYLTDLGSTNGTVVNGVKIAPNERLRLSDGDEVHIGQTRFRFESLDAKPEAEEEIQPEDKAPAPDEAGGP